MAYEGDKQQYLDCRSPAKSGDRSGTESCEKAETRWGQKHQFIC